MLLRMENLWLRNILVSMGMQCLRSPSRAVLLVSRSFCALVFRQFARIIVRCGLGSSCLRRRSMCLLAVTLSEETTTDGLRLVGLARWWSLLVDLMVARLGTRMKLLGCRLLCNLLASLRQTCNVCMFTGEPMHIGMLGTCLLCLSLDSAPSMILAWLMVNVGMSMELFCVTACWTMLVNFLRGRPLGLGRL